ncbi:MAG: hypothetical protein FWH06_07345, partial [Oscillospiraceae bacterium]|nr:hypothetical protein [Oscillospiraceae bacterium]
MERLMGQDLGLQLDDAALERYGANEAKLLDVKGYARARAIRRRVAVSLNVIESVSGKTAAWSAANQSIPQAFEWLLDNRYLLEREGKQVLLSLRGTGRLPLDRATLRPAAGAAMRSLVRVTRGEVTLQGLQMFLKGFQSERVLTERELSLLIPLLKAALLEMAASVCVELREVLEGFRMDARVNPYAAERAVLLAITQGSAPPPGIEGPAARAREKYTAQSARLGSAVTSLRMLAAADADPLLQEASAIERVLRDDPSGHYKSMSDESRIAYRQELCRLSKRFGVSERNAASQAVRLASEQPDGPKRHAGYYIFTRPLGHNRARLAGRVYFICMAAAAALGTAAVWALTGRWWAALAAAVPIWDAAKYLCDCAAVRLKPPSHIPRMEYAQGLPDEGRALCVITAVLSKPEQAAEFARRLEQYRLCNRDAGHNALYGLLYDLPDREHRVEPGEEDIDRAALHEISALNQKYGGFYLFSRERVYSETERGYMGWERKRGALIELMRSLRGKSSGIRARVGDPSVLPGVKYLITLDADTRLSAGTLRPLIGAMLHPLNQPVVDPVRKVVTGGYGMLQPRMAVELTAANVNWFTRLYAGQGGLDPYTGSVSDVYQDLFGRGAFVGKGAISVDAFMECLDGRLPEGRILSHDLLEGSYLRAGLIGDIEWADGYPSHVSAWLERSHRWVRGDWQIASWLRRRVPAGDKAPGASGRRASETNPLAGLPRYQIFDNLRRSVTAPVNMLILAAFALSPYNAAPAVLVCAVLLD